MADDELATLVRSYETAGHGGSALIRTFARHVSRCSGRYPHAYFELGRRDDASLESLTNRVFTSCARISKGRFPFAHRTPFLCYLEEEFDDPPIRHHSFYARLSITREILRDDYARNLSRDPELRRRDTIYRELGPLLEAHGVPHEQGRRPPLWSAPEAGVRRVRSPDEVAATLRREPARPLDALVPRALELLGTPISRSRLAHLLAEVTPAAEGVHEAPDATEDLPTRVAVRGAIQRGWANLDDLDRQLVVSLARGDSADEILARDPRLRHRVAVSRAISRVGTHFVAAVIEEVGGEAEPSGTPRAMMEHVIRVLLEILPDLEG